MIGRLAIIEADGFSDQLGTGLGPALLQSNHAQQMQCIRVIRVDCQDVTVKGGSLFQLSATMQTHGFGE